jgi:hypothetical protein
VKSPTLALIGILASGGVIGCFDNSPPPPRVHVPPGDGPNGAPLRERDLNKPMPRDEMANQLPPPPFNDAPIVNQRPPEQTGFVDAYNRVGRPRIAVVMNHSLEGNLVATSASPAQDSYDRNRPPADLRIDYQAMENALCDVLACNGQVTLITPTIVRQKLTSAQMNDLQNGREQALTNLANQTGADVLVQVQARPTEPTRDGPQVRLYAEAINTQGGVSIGRAVYDAAYPLDKAQIDSSMRQVGRKLEDEMTGTWMAPPPNDMRRDDNAPPHDPQSSSPQPPRPQMTPAPMPAPAPANPAPPSNPQPTPAPAPAPQPTPNPSPTPPPLPQNAPPP